MKKKLSFLFFLFVLFFSAQAFCEISSSFGVNAHTFGENFGDLPWIEKAGIKWARVDFFWDGIEKEKGVFSWALTDKIVKEAKKHSVQLLPVLLGTPSWALPAGAEKSEWVPPANVSDYADFVRHVAARYKNDIQYYEIWNEENGPVFWKPFPDVKQYTQLLKAAAEAVHKECAPCRVVLGGLAGVDIQFLELLYKEKGAPYFDVVGIHPYRLFSKSPARGGLAEDLQSLKTLMERYGDKDKPLWITEIGWPTHKRMKHGWVPVTQEQQANYLVESFVLAWSEGIEKIFWYDFKNDGTDENYFEHNQGLMTKDYKPKLSYGAYRYLSGIFKKARFVKMKSWNKRNKAYYFKTPDEAVVVLWDDVGKSTVSFNKNIFSRGVDKSGREFGEVKDGKAALDEAPMFLFSKDAKIADLEALTFVWKDKNNMSKKGKETL